MTYVTCRAQVSGFVEFADVSTAAMAHSGLQGALLASSNRGPIRIQYSKNPFGRRSGDTGYGQQPQQGMHAAMATGLAGGMDFGWPTTYTLS